MLRFLILFSWLICFSQSASAAVEHGSWPKLDNNAGGAVCNKALAIAKTVFLSDAFYTYAPPTVPESVGAKLVVAPDNVDISGGDELTVDETVFQKIPKHGNGPPRNILWQMKDNGKFRWALDSDPVGWRGDMYSLFPVESDVTPDQFLENTQEQNKAGGLKPLMYESWRPPLLLQENESGDVWAIDVGQSWGFLNPWKVYLLDANGAQKKCSIAFRPDARSGIDLLPQPVRELDRLLKKTQATHEEGTLQPTGRRLVVVDYMWANAAARPWVPTTAYDSRQEVDAGLERWSHDSPYTQRLYKKIYRQYPVAEQALKKYYRIKFRKSSKEAASLASSTLDAAFRSYFSFPHQ